jgi:hypothetical protein
MHVSSRHRSEALDASRRWCRGRRGRLRRAGPAKKSNIALSAINKPLLGEDTSSRVRWNEP